MADELRALLISYAFPPVGGVGIQRAVKLCKYLPEHGVTPSVLTVANASAPLRDSSFDRDLPAGMTIARARTFEPGYAAKQASWQAVASDNPSLRRRVVRQAVSVARRLMIPDPQLLWLPGAASALTGICLRPAAPDAVVITSPPFSQFLLGPLARLLRGRAVILDYRDEWSTLMTMYEMLRSDWASRAGAELEALVVRAAQRITTATEEFRENLLARFPFLDPARVVAIPNGYDPDDFPPQLPDPPPDRFVVTYAGTVFKQNSAQGLLRAVRRLHEARPELAQLLELRFIGRIVDTELGHFENTDKLGVQRLGYLPHDQMLQKLAASHLTLCTLDAIPDVERILPAKIFELMVLGRPVLTLAPTGALTRLVERHRLGDVLAPRDEAAIADYLARQLEAFQQDRRAPTVSTDHEGIARYHRRALAGQFADVIREAVADAR